MPAPAPPPPAARAPRRRSACARVACTCCGAGLALLQRRLRLRGRRRAPAVRAALGNARRRSAPRHRGAVPPRRRLRGVGVSHRRVVLLLRDLFLRDQRLQALHVAPGAGRLGLALPLERLRRGEPRPRGRDLVLRGRDVGLCLLDAAAARWSRPTWSRCARSARRRCAASAEACALGELGLRAVEGRLVIARVDLDEDGAGRHGLVVLHVRRGSPAAHLRGNLRDVAVDLRVVGRLAARVVPPRRPTTAAETSASGDDASSAAGLPRAPTRVTEGCVVGHRLRLRETPGPRPPPIPIARASIALAMLRRRARPCSSRWRPRRPPATARPRCCPPRRRRSGRGVCVSCWPARSTPGLAPPRAPGSAACRSRSAERTSKSMLSAQVGRAARGAAEIGGRGLRDARLLAAAIEHGDHAPTRRQP